MNNYACLDVNQNLHHRHAYLYTVPFGRKYGAWLSLHYNYFGLQESHLVDALVMCNIFLKWAHGDAYTRMPGLQIPG